MSQLTFPITVTMSIRTDETYYPPRYDSSNAHAPPQGEDYSALMRAVESNYFDDCKRPFYDWLEDRPVGGDANRNGGMMISYSCEPLKETAKNLFYAILRERLRAFYGEPPDEFRLSLAAYAIAKSWPR